MDKMYYGLLYTVQEPGGVTKQDTLFADDNGDAFTNLEQFDGVEEAVRGFAEQLGCKILDFHIVKFTVEPLD